MDVLAVAAALASRGHNVSVVVPQDDIPFSRSAASRHGGGDGADLLEWIAYDMPFTVNSEVMRDMAARVKGVRNPLRVLANLMEVMGRPCSLMFSNATLMAALESGRYEAVLTFNMPGDWADSCGCVLAHSLGVPLMTVHGIPFITAPLSVPQFGSGLDDQALATWRGRTRNLLSFMMTRTMSAVTGIVSRRSMAGIRRQRRLPRGPASQGRACAPMLQLDANSFHLDPPRPLGPPHALIGPIAPRFARPSLEPPEVAAFVDSAPAGVAVVSFGSAPIFGTFLTRKDFLELSLAFADLAPTRVVWLLKPRNMPDDVSIGELPLGDNTITAPWVDINDLVGHRNVKLFVTHAGCHSAYEAVFHGKPVVGVPFQFEQQINAMRLQALGMGRVSSQAPSSRRQGETYTHQALGALMQQVMSDPSYSAAGARISAAARLRAALRPPLELAVQEVEMALTHRDYGRWRPYSVDGGRGHGRGADLDSGAPLSSHPEL